MTYNLLPYEVPKLQGADGVSSEAMEFYADQIINNLERLIPVLDKVEENIEEEIKIINKMRVHTQGYSK